ncbi:MAG: AAA family ATPase [Thermoplasmata archaeon]|nr:AAA family ATPase [Thermoplasmata archaeon]
MHLISLELHNFRKFKNASLQFPEGIIGIIGSNGAGKTTLIEAIGWALYGNKATRTPRAKEQIKRQGALPHDDCWVRLRFEMKGNEYEVIRIMGKNFSPDAQVKINGRVAATTATGATKFLEKAMGMDYDSFYTSIVAKQKELNALSDKTPGERKKNMLKMLKIDAIEKAIKKVREDKREKNYFVEHAQKLLKNIDEINEEIETKETIEKELLTSLKSLGEKIDDYGEKLYEIEVRREKEREKAEKYNELLMKKKMLESRLGEKINNKREKEKELNELILKRKRYSEIEGAANEYDEAKRKKDELDGLRERFFEKKNLIRERLEIEKNIKKLKEEKEALIKEIEKFNETKLMKSELEKKLMEVDEKILHFEKEMRGKEVEMKQILKEKEKNENRMNEIRRLGPESNCPMCGRKLGSHFEKLIKDLTEQEIEFETRINDLKSMIEEHKREIEELRKRKMEFEEEKRKLEKNLSRMEGIKDKISFYENDISSKESRLTEIIERLEELKDIKIDEEEYTMLVTRLKQLEKIKFEAIKLQKEIERIPLLEDDLKRIASEIISIENSLHEIDREIKEVGFDRKMYESVENEYKEMRNEIEKLRGEKIKMERDLLHLRKEIESLKKEMEEQRKKGEEIKEARKQIANLSLLEDLLLKFKNYLISKIAPSLSFYASHFFSVFTGGKYDNVEIDDDYNIFIYDRGEKFPINRFSGGEEDLANLALRLAISELIARRADTNFEFIALDEIFGSQDNERRKNVLNALNELRKQFKQILLITHIEEIKEETEHIIRVYEDSEGVSHIRLEGR